MPLGSDRKIQTVRGTNQIAGFDTLPSQKKNVTLHGKRGLIQISCYGYFHGHGREVVKNFWNVSEISLSRHENISRCEKGHALSVVKIR